MKEHPYFTGFLVTEEGQVFSKKTGRKLRQHENAHGYLTTKVFDPEYCAWKQRRVHRLVAETYIDNKESKPEINHKDGNKQNNNVSNLEWVTSKENKTHAWRKGLYKDIGEVHFSSNLSNEQVHEMCRMMQEGFRNKEISEYFNLHKDRVSEIRSGNKWGHISSLYNTRVVRNKRKSPDTVIKVAELLEKGFSIKEVAEETGVKEYDIRRIKSRKIFSSLTKNYRL